MAPAKRYSNKVFLLHAGESNYLYHRKNAIKRGVCEYHLMMEALRRTGYEPVPVDWYNNPEFRDLTWQEKNKHLLYLELQRKAQEERVHARQAYEKVVHTSTVEELLPEGWFVKEIDFSEL